MTPLFQKLQWSADLQTMIFRAPDSFKPEMEKALGKHPDLEENLSVRRAFFLAFVTKTTDIDNFTRRVKELTEGDAVVWFAYPKGSNKNLKTDIHRDKSFGPMLKSGWQNVQTLALDEDWCALRFRRDEFAAAPAEKGEKAKSKKK